MIDTTGKLQSFGHSLKVVKGKHLRFAYKNGCMVKGRSCATMSYSDMIPSYKFDLIPDSQLKTERNPSYQYFSND